MHFIQLLIKNLELARLFIYAWVSCIVLLLCAEVIYVK